MSTIKIQCIDQTLTLTHTPVIASGGVSEDYVQFSFCSQWDGFAKTAVFWRSEEEAYHVLLDDTGTGLIPAEVLVEDGVLHFGVFGVNADQVRRTSEVLHYTVCQGAYVEGSQPADPTPSIYEQLLASYAEAMHMVAVYDPEGKVQAAGGIEAFGDSKYALVAVYDPEGKVQAAGGIEAFGDGKYALVAVYDPEGKVQKAGGIEAFGDGKYALVAVYDPEGKVKKAGGIEAFGDGKYALATDAAFKSTVVQATIGTDWTDTEPPTQTLQVEGVTADNIIEITLPATATAAEFKAYRKLNLQDGGQAEGSITLRAFGDLNLIDIPVTITIRRDT